MTTEARVKHLEDMLTLNLGDISNFHEGHPEYEILKGRIELYAGEYRQLTGKYFTITRRALMERSSKD